jgi:hypothetical protein
MVEEGKSVQQAEVPDYLELLYDLGNGLSLYMAKLDRLREQDINARIMPPKEYAQLVNNIRSRGGLESVPYCVRMNGRVEVVSGHHRIRAAKEAGVDEAPVLIDESGMNRSQVIAKQLAHNRLAGMDDTATLRQLFQMLNSPSDILASGLADDLLELPEVELEPVLAPHMDMDWRTVSFAFLPHQVEKMKALIEQLPASDMVWVGLNEQFESFMKAVVGYARLKRILSAGIAIAVLTDIALKQLEADADAAGTVDDEGVSGEALPAPSAQS